MSERLGSDDVRGAHAAVYLRLYSGSALVEHGSAGYGHERSRASRVLVQPGNDNSSTAPELMSVTHASAGMHTELFVEVAEVRFGGLVAEEEPGGHLLVAEPSASLLIYPKVKQ
jgi:hypothetical protein